MEYLYEAPLAMEKEHLAQVACECLNLDVSGTGSGRLDKYGRTLSKHPTSEVNVALVGKYIQLHDAYISVVEALKHGGIDNRAVVNIKWIDSETVTEENADELLGDVTGILVPGGFGSRGIDGKITAIKYAREHKIPFLGLCLGMQLSIVEYARNVAGLDGCPQHRAGSEHPVPGDRTDAGSERCGGYRRNLTSWFLPMCAG